MTQRDMAGYIDVTPVTLRNWRKNKPELYEIIMKGFAFDDIVELNVESAEKAKELKKKFEGGK
ncbi:hypothetical protein [Sulfurimonas sp.]|jgi:hypothetical protein|uniref:hypothetical protein n=1 Tax=Sulfurimonas sp. TaxID=2022749 RepID=UPI0025DE409A|nr:hypothetical protein [Sulfurimonas sp.]MBT5934089.1 hypothetical protein [Sulfurimonas sp.]